ncbi:Pyridine nucleotide-disulfide oxidoreductase domain-containing protein 2 [Blattella germanica]|nr:Pyridine nucleotide-disulfide oxidoreductase domain-containing protein 2 [Blattella germanica]
MEVLAPPDLEEIFGLTGGVSTFVRICFSEEESEIQLQCSIKNLLICGSGAHPGGGVMGAPGHIAAQAAIATLTNRRKK